MLGCPRWAFRLIETYVCVCVCERERAIGMQVKASARVVSVEGSKVDFTITCFQGPKFEAQVMSAHAETAMYDDS